MMREAQRLVVGQRPRLAALRGFRIRAQDRSSGSAPGRSGSEPSLRSTCPSRASLPRRASKALQDDGDGAVPALRELSDAEAWRLAADGYAGSSNSSLVSKPRLIARFASLPLISYCVLVQLTRAKRFLQPAQIDQCHHTLAVGT